MISSSESETLESAFDSCQYCGRRFRSDQWYPVVTETDGTGGVELHSFCDEGCRSAWETS